LAGPEKGDDQNKTKQNIVSNRMNREKLPNQFISELQTRRSKAYTRAKPSQ